MSIIRRSFVRIACLMTATGGAAAAFPPPGGILLPEIACPPGATAEGEPCDESGQGTVNGGCLSTPPAFIDVACGQTLCGEAWALGGVRDTENFLMLVDGVDAASATITSEFPAVLWGTNAGSAGFDCDVVYVVESTEVDAGGTGSITLPFEISDGDTLWWFVGASIFDGLPCGSGGEFGNGYVVSWSCAETSCLEAGDVDGDGTVDFEDLLGVLANFGPCP